MTRQDGYEYAVRRDEDGAWLYDADFTGARTAWESDAENATWTATAVDAVSLADLSDLTDGTQERLLPGYTLWRRGWVDEESVDSDDFEFPEPEPVPGL